MAWSEAQEGTNKNGLSLHRRELRVVNDDLGALNRSEDMAGYAMAVGVKIERRVARRGKAAPAAG